MFNPAGHAGQFPLAQPRMISKLLLLAIPVKPPMAVNTIFAPFWPRAVTLQLKTLLEQLMFAAASPVSVNVKLCQATPVALRKCNTPKPVLGTLNPKLKVVIGVQLLFGQPNGSRTIIPGSTVSACAAVNDNETAMARINTFIEGFTFRAP